MYLNKYNKTIPINMLMNRVKQAAPVIPDILLNQDRSTQCSGWSERQEEFGQTRRHVATETLRKTETGSWKRLEAGASRYDVITPFLSCQEVGCCILDDLLQGGEVVTDQVQHAKSLATKAPIIF